MGFVVILLTSWMPLAQAAAFDCEDALASQKTRAILKLAELALERKLVAPELLEQSLQQTPPQNPLARMTLSSADLALSAAFDRILKSGVSVDELRLQVDALAKKYHWSHVIASGAESDTRKLIHPRILGELEFLYPDLPKYTWTRNSDNDLQLAVWSKVMSYVRFYSPYDAKTIQTQVKLEGTEHLTGLAVQGYQFVAAYSHQQELPWWRPFKRKEALLKVQSPAFASTLKASLRAPATQIFLHQNKSQQVFAYVIEPQGFEMFEILPDQIKLVRFVPHAFDSSPVLTTAEDREGNLSVFAMADRQLFEYRPSLGESAVRHWELDFIPNNLYAHIRPNGDSVVAASYRGRSITRIAFLSPSQKPAIFQSDYIQIDKFVWFDRADGTLLAALSFGAFDVADRTLVLTVEPEVKTLYSGYGEIKNDFALVKLSNGQELFFKCKKRYSEVNRYEIVAYDTNNFEAVKRLNFDFVEDFTIVEAREGQPLLLSSNEHGLQVQEALTDVELKTFPAESARFVLPAALSERGEWIQLIRHYEYQNLKFLALDRMPSN